MENKEYLNEENYQKAKKKITRISLIILIVGLVIGGGLIAIGAVKQSNAKKESEERVEKAKERLSEIKTEKEELNAKIAEKQYECDSLEMGSDDWFANSTKCDRKVSNLEQKVIDLELEEFKLQNENYKEFYVPVLPIKYLIFYYIGGSVIVISGIISLVFYLIAKRREIRAFTIQQTMPVTQEAIDKMAPTVGNAAGNIAGSIAKGIKDGLKDDKENM